MRFTIISLSLLIFTLFSCKTTKETPESANTMSIEESRNIFTNKLSVKAKKGVSAKDFEKRYQEYELKYRGLSSKSQNILAFTFNNNLISSPALVDLIKTDKYVLDVTPLRKAETRVFTSKSGDKKKGKLSK